MLNHRLRLPRHGRMNRAYPIYNAALYGRAHLIHNPREHHGVDLGGAAAQQRPRTGIEGGARGEHVVDQHETAAGDLGAGVVRYPERALDVADQLGIRLAELLWRRPDEDED